jgi:signal transduction histidine kinase
MPKLNEYFDVIKQETVAAVRTISNPPGGMRCRGSLDAKPFMVRAHPNQPRQVFSNLLANAPQAMENKGGISGLRPAARPPIIPSPFKVRDRASGPRRAGGCSSLFGTRIKGTSLSFTMYRQIVERHGGTIAATDHDGPGTAFRIRLPR